MSFKAHPSLRQQPSFSSLPPQCSPLLSRSRALRLAPPPGLLAMLASGASPPLKGISPTDRGGVILVSAYSWACLSIVAAGARFVIMWIRKVQPEADDASFGAALVCRLSPTQPLSTSWIRTRLTAPLGPRRRFHAMHSLGRRCWARPARRTRLARESRPLLQGMF
jgi:hypothetical protein